MDIKFVEPVSRNCQEITFDDNARVYRVNTVQNHLYYLTPKKKLMPIDVLDRTIEKASGDKNMVLRSKNIASVGFKVDDDPYKYLGLRPDCVQDGSEQLEFSIQSIEFDGKPQPINLSSNQPISSTLTEIGPLVYVQSLRQRTRQLVKVVTPISSFKVTYQINVTGLNLVKHHEVDEYWLYSKATKEFRFRIVAPYLVGVDGEPHEVHDAVKHSLFDHKDGTFTYIKESAIDLSEINAPYFIDADTVYSNTTDGRVSYGVIVGSPVGATTTAYSNESASVYATYDSYNPDAIQWESKYSTVRSFFYFPIMAVGGSILQASISVRGYSRDDTGVAVQRGTQGTPLSSNDFNAYSGSYWGRSSSYWSTSGYNTMTLNDDGLMWVGNAIGGIFRVCMREYDYDYRNRQAPVSGVANGCYYADNVGTDKDPYLLYTLGPGGIKTINGLRGYLIKTLNGLPFTSIKTLKGLE